MSEPKVMGIINMTPDSFFERSRHSSALSAMRSIEQMVKDGASIIDIGACSTRPGSKSPGVDEEWIALKPILELLATEMPKLSLSIDTFRSEIVERCADTFGDIIVNDISAGEDDRNMLACVAKNRFTYIAMHKRGTPETMQQNCIYTSLIEDIHDYFVELLKKAERADIKRVIIDPGFGFSKTVDQNYTLLAGLKRLQFYYKGEEAPILAGLSRKSMIYRLLGITPEESLPATFALNLQALINGASIIRVHDVKEGDQAVRIFLKMRESL